MQAVEHTVQNDNVQGKVPRTLSVPVFTQRTFRQIWQEKLPYLNARDRIVIKLLVYWMQRYIISVDGLENIQPENGPFILAMNHNQKSEAIAVPATLFFYGKGKKIHFFSDWNFQMIPIVSYIIRRSEVITVTRKSAKPKFLNVLKPIFEPPEPPFVLAKKWLEKGDSVGVYPEGTVNRNPDRLLKGFSGMARLSVETGRPVVPLGISFPNLPKGKMIPDWEPMVLKIGKAMYPPVVEENASLEKVRSWHAEVMTVLADLSHKQWSENSTRKK